MKLSKEAGVRRYIFASSGSVYGVSDDPNVTEEHPLVPVSLYNKYKGMCEPLLFKHKADNFTCSIIRPATVCGYSPRTRLDLKLVSRALGDTLAAFGYGGNFRRAPAQADARLEWPLALPDIAFARPAEI